MSPNNSLQIEVLAEQIARLERTNFILKLVSAVLTLGLALVAANPVGANRVLKSLAPLTTSELRIPAR